MVTILAYHDLLATALNGIANAGRALFEGNIAEILPNLIVTFPVVGAFLVMYGLVYFAGIISIFKQTDHHRYARYIAVGISLIGLLNADVMSFLVTFMGGSMIIILLLIMVVSFIVGKWVNARKGHFENAAGKDQAKASALERKRAMRGQAQENKMQRKLHRTEDDTLAKIDTKMMATLQLQRTSKGTIKEMISVLSRIAAMGAESKERERLQLHLTSKIGAFSRQIDEEYLDLESIRGKMQKLEVLQVNEINVAKTEQTNLKYVKKYMESILGHKIDSTLAEAQKDKELRERMLYLENQADLMSKRLYQLYLNKRSLVKNIEDYVLKVENTYRTSILDSKQKLTASLHAGDIPSAINTLHHLFELISAIENADTNIKFKIEEIEQFERDIEHIEDDLNKLVGIETSKRTMNGAESGKENYLIRKTKQFTNRIRRDKKKATQDVKEVKKDIGQVKSQENQTRKNTGNT